MSQNPDSGGAGDNTKQLATIKRGLEIGANVYSIARNEIPYNLNLAEAGFVNFKNKNIVPIAPLILTTASKPKSISITGVRSFNSPLRCIGFSYKSLRPSSGSGTCLNCRPSCLTSLQREDGTLSSTTNNIVGFYSHITIEEQVSMLRY